LRLAPPRRHAATARYRVTAQTQIKHPLCGGSMARRVASMLIGDAASAVRHRAAATARPKQTEMHMRKTTVAAFGLSLLAATGLVHAQAQAQDSGGYLLGAFGKSSYDIDCEGFRQCDKSGSLTKVVAGYRMNQGLAIEGIALAYRFSKAVWFEAGYDGTSGEIEGDSDRVTGLSLGAGLRF